MNRSRSGFVALVTTATLLALSPAAQAFEVVSDTEAMVCRIDPADQTSDTRAFWEQLETDARDARLAELDEVDPGIATAVRNYRPEDSAGELQQRLADAGAEEGLGTLITVTAEDIGAEGPDTPEFQTEYTEQEAREAAGNIGADPATPASAALHGQAAAEAGTRLDEIRAGLFDERAAEYNRAQAQLQENLRSCAGALDDARGTATWVWLAGAAVVLLLVITVVRAWLNSRSPSRHAH